MWCLCMWCVHQWICRLLRKWKLLVLKFTVSNAIYQGNVDCQIFECGNLSTTMAALNFSNIFRCLAAKNCPVGRCGTLVSPIIAERHLSSTHTRVLNHLHPRIKYGRTEGKSAGIVPADRRQACSHAATKVTGSRSSGVDHDGSGSSGRENREVRRIDLRY